jgi:hypothetical protein
MVGQITKNWNALMTSIRSSGPIIRELWAMLHKEKARPQFTVGGFELVASRQFRPNDEL